MSQISSDKVLFQKDHFEMNSPRDLKSEISSARFFRLAEELSFFSDPGRLSRLLFSHYCVRSRQLDASYEAMVTVQEML